MISNTMVTGGHVIKTTTINNKNHKHKNTVVVLSPDITDFASFFFFSTKFSFYTDGGLAYSRKFYFWKLFLFIFTSAPSGNNSRGANPLFYAVKTNML